MPVFQETRISGTIVDLFQRRSYPGTVVINGGKISTILEETDAPERVIVPGFVDGHIHIESSMLTPSEFARLAVRHGTVATVSDPHEIANVLGLPGVEFMLANAATTPFKFNFTAPSCVPATSFETTGAQLNVAEIDSLLQRDEIVGLSEMMNIPGVLNDEPDVLAKIASAVSHGKPVDGHAPELRGAAATSYIQAGITTDHECVTLEEAQEKLDQNMLVQIREGSAAKNLDDLTPLLHEHYRQCMLCSDDKHPDDLVEGHINDMVRRAIRSGVNPYNALWSACVTPVLHYGLDIGLLREGDPADLVVLNDLDSCEVLETWIAGECVARGGRSLLEHGESTTPNHFKAQTVTEKDFSIYSSQAVVPVIQVVDGQLVTGKVDWDHQQSQENIEADPRSDTLKLAVLNRYSVAEPAIGFVRGFQIGEGALVSSVAHDSHNIIAVATSDAYLAEAMNLIIRHKGGVAAISPEASHIIPLPVAGIMSADDGFQVGAAYARLNELAGQMGSTLSSPFMTLSFMALLVIPELKLSDRGLFDGREFAFLDVFQTIPP